MNKEITLFKDFNSKRNARQVIREKIRKIAIAGVSGSRKMNKVKNWIRFPYYHHVFDDEKIGFERQLKYLKDSGEFINMDQACDLMEGKQAINGRYYCVSFDDGYHNCFTNMLEITANLQIPVIIYLPSDYIYEEGNYKETVMTGSKSEGFIKYLNWSECREMQHHLVTFGSHTCSHAHLIELMPEQIRDELFNSKKVIEDKLEIDCLHFASPWGHIDVDFPPISTSIAKEIGYRSFATANRGPMYPNSNCYLVKRDHLLANWENFQVKYFLV